MCVCVITVHFSAVKQHLHICCYLLVLYFALKLAVKLWPEAWWIDNHFSLDWSHRDQLISLSSGLDQSNYSCSRPAHCGQWTWSECHWEDRTKCNTSALQIRVLRGSYKTWARLQEWRALNHHPSQIYRQALCMWDSSSPASNIQHTSFPFLSSALNLYSKKVHSNTVQLTQRQKDQKFTPLAACCMLRVACCMTACCTTYQTLLHSKGKAKASCCACIVGLQQPLPDDQIQSLVHLLGKYIIHETV